METDRYSCTRREQGDLVIVMPQGEIDLAVAARFWDELHPWLTPATHLVVDCSGVTFMDSMGLRSLLQAVRTATNNSADFALAVPSAAVTRILELAGVTDLFTVLNAVPAPAPEV